LVDQKKLKKFIAKKRAILSETVPLNNQKMHQSIRCHS